MKRAALFTLCAFVFSIPLENVFVIPGFGTMCKAIGGLAAFLAVVAHCHSPRSIEPFHKWVLVFIALTAVSLLWTNSQEETLYRTGLYSQLFVMIWMLWQHTTVTEIRFLMRAYIYGEMLACASTIMNYLNGAKYLGVLTSDTRYAATGFDPNDIALTLAVGIPIGWYLGTRGSPLSRYFHRGYVPLAFMAILLAASRGGVISLGVSLFSLLFVGGRLSGVKRVVLVAVIAVTMGGLVLLAPTAGTDRLLSTGQELRTGNLSNRVDIWLAGLRLFVQSPLVGIGAGGFRTAVVPELGKEVVAHNTYLAILAELGILGALVFVTVVGLCVRTVRRLPLTERRLWEITLLTLGVGVFSLSWDINKNAWLIIGLAVAHSSAVRGRRLKGVTGRIVLYRYSVPSHAAGIDKRRSAFQGAAGQLL